MGSDPASASVAVLCRSCAASACGVTGAGGVTDTPSRRSRHIVRRDPRWFHGVGGGERSACAQPAADGVPGNALPAGTELLQDWSALGRRGVAREQLDSAARQARAAHRLAHLERAGGVGRGRVRLAAAARLGKALELGGERQLEDVALRPGHVAQAVAVAVAQAAGAAGVDQEGAAGPQDLGADVVVVAAGAAQVDRDRLPGGGDGQRRDRLGVADLRQRARRARGGDLRDLAAEEPPAPGRPRARRNPPRRRPTRPGRRTRAAAGRRPIATSAGTWACRSRPRRPAGGPRRTATPSAARTPRRRPGPRRPPDRPAARSPPGRTPPASPTARRGRSRAPPRRAGREAAWGRR